MLRAACRAKAMKSAQAAPTACPCSTALHSRTLAVLLRFAAHAEWRLVSRVDALKLAVGLEGQQAV